MQVRNGYRMEEWKQIIQECRRSGLSNKAYCQQQGISEKTYYLLAAKSAHGGSGAGGATDRGTGAKGGKTDRSAVYPVSGSGTDAAGRDGHGGSGSGATVGAAAMIDLRQVSKYYVACGYTDLRRGIDGLAAMVTQQYGKELREDSLFLFCGRRTDRIKALYYSGDGYVLLYKRLNNGAFQWPRTAAELRLLDARSFRWLMEGLSVEQPKAIQKGRAKDLF